MKNRRTNSGSGEEHCDRPIRTDRLDSPPGGGSIVGAIATLLSIGDFPRMTFLSVKALCHYHEIDLLAPASIDADSRCRQYAPSQVPSAQVIRRLRDPGMPLEDVKTVVQAPDVDTRNAAIIAHLHRMEHELQRTQRTVASPRAPTSAARRRSRCSTAPSRRRTPSQIGRAHV